MMPQSNRAAYLLFDLCINNGKYWIGLEFAINVITKNPSILFLHLTSLHLRPHHEQNKHSPNIRNLNRKVFPQQIKFKQTQSFISDDLSLRKLVKKKNAHNRKSGTCHIGSSLHRMSPDVVLSAIYPHIKQILRVVL